MGHRPIQQKNGPLTTEIAILNLDRMAHWNFGLPSYNTGLEESALMTELLRLISFTFLYKFMTFIISF